MLNKPRKGLPDIRTRSGLTSEAENPQRKFLRIASLELKRSLCTKVRDAARKRSEQMDDKIAELDADKAHLLASSRVVEAGAAEPAATPRPIGDLGSPARRGFMLKY
jgi:hypothetical protein